MSIFRLTPIELKEKIEFLSQTIESIQQELDTRAFTSGRAILHLTNYKELLEREKRSLEAQLPVGART